MEVEIPFCLSNENAVEKFLGKKYKLLFTHRPLIDHKFSTAVNWYTKKTESFFYLKDKNLYPSCKTYKGTCSYSEDYADETKRNTEIRLNEQENPNKGSEPLTLIWQIHLT